MQFTHGSSFAFNLKIAHQSRNDTELLAVVSKYEGRGKSVVMILIIPRNGRILWLFLGIFIISDTVAG
jgi:hypothetical protein